MINTKRTPIDAFRGLQNVSDPLSLDNSWLMRADNCIITDRGKLQRAGGFSRVDAADISTGAYATIDQQRLYWAVEGSIYQVIAPPDEYIWLTNLTTSDPVRFAEVNGVVYYSNGTDFGALYPTGLRAWGIPNPPSPLNVTRQSGSLPAGTYQVCLTYVDPLGMESGNGPVIAISVPDNSALAITGIAQMPPYATCVYATDANGSVFKRISDGADSSMVWSAPPESMGIELGAVWCNPPHGVLPAYWGGRMWTCDPYPTLDLTAVWRSLPIHYHLFDDGSEGMAVPGTVRMMMGCDEALIIGTDRAIYAWDDAKLTMLAPYGVTPGDHAKLFRGDVYFWSLRGACKALPFENMTEHTYSFAPGTSAAAAVIEAGGFRRYVVALNAGGTPYNAYQP